MVAIIVGTLGGVFFVVLIIVGAILYKKYRVVKKDIKTTEMELNDPAASFSKNNFESIFSIQCRIKINKTNQ